MLHDYFVLWLVFSFVSGFVGMYVEGRCRPGTAGREGFWHGFLLGPIGWILVALYPNYPRKH